MTMTSGTLLAWLKAKFQLKLVFIRNGLCNTFFQKLKLQHVGLAGI